MTTFLTIDSFGRHGQFEDDGHPTKTSLEQKKVESCVAQCFYQYDENLDEETFKNTLLFVLSRKSHVVFLERALFGGLSSSLESLDSSRPWLVYWITHSLALLGESEYLQRNGDKIADLLQRCASPSEGGYGGGPGQLAHLAATYAAVNATVTLNHTHSLTSIDRAAIRNFLSSLEQPNGSFILHKDGEVDIRGVYCAVSVARLLNIAMDGEDGLFANTADWLLRCQTYEGGFGAAPGHEAHGGYTFCGVASLAMLGQLAKCDVDSLLRWTVNKQLKLEGGFAGRTNKLVDGCYSFWVSAVVALVQGSCIKPEYLKNIDGWLFNGEALQEYILAACQLRRGGLRDKPGKNPDYYHTSYALAGLSIAQHSSDPDGLLGPRSNLVQAIDPIHNIHTSAMATAKTFFSQCESSV